MGIKWKRWYTCFCDICNTQYDFHDTPYFPSTKDLSEEIISMGWVQKDGKWHCVECLSKGK